MCSTIQRNKGQLSKSFGVLSMVNGSVTIYNEVKTGEAKKVSVDDEQLSYRTSCFG